MNLRDMARALWPHIAPLFMKSGTFTPTLVGSGTAGTFTYDTTNTRAEYTRIGDRVFVNGRVRITATAVAPTGNMAIGGLPIASGSGSGGTNGNILGTADVLPNIAVNWQAGYTQFGGVIVGSAKQFLVVETGDNVALAQAQGGEFGATVDLYFSGSYKV